MKRVKSNLKIVKTWDIIRSSHFTERQTYMLLASSELQPWAAFSRPLSQCFPIQTDPKPVNNILIFFSCGKLAHKWVCLRNFVIESAYVPFTNHFVKKLMNKNASKSDARQRKMSVLKNRSTLNLYVMLVAVSSPVEFSRSVFFWCEISCCHYKNNFCESLQIIQNQTFLLWIEWHIPRKFIKCTWQKFSKVQQRSEVNLTKINCQLLLKLYRHTITCH